MRRKRDRSPRKAWYQQSPKARVTSPHSTFSSSADAGVLIVKPGAALVGPPPASWRRRVVAWADGLLQRSPDASGIKPTSVVVLPGGEIRMQLRYGYLRPGRADYRRRVRRRSGRR